MFSLMICFRLPFSLFTGIPKRGIYQNHNIHANRIFCFVALVVSENWHFAPALSFKCLKYDTEDDFQNHLLESPCAELETVSRAPVRYCSP